MEKLPFITVESVCFYRPEGEGVIAPISFNGMPELCITIGSVRSFKILVLAIEHFGAVARFKLRNSGVLVPCFVLPSVLSEGSCGKRLVLVHFGV